jgi:hypothetical protein
MSTKDISRSALEKGRSNSYDRNESHSRERAHTRKWLSTVCFDPEAADESYPEPRNKVSKREGFTDKLNPCYGWLRSRIGQPWSKVYSELTGLFDTRKLSAWHIVNQHMLSEVNGAGTRYDGLGFPWRSQTFYIDEEGVFRFNPERVKRTRSRYKGPTRAQVLARVGERAVVDYGGSQFWADPVRGRWVHCNNNKNCGVTKHRAVDVTSPVLVELYTSGTHRAFKDSRHWRVYRLEHFEASWRQSKRFSSEEAAWWASIHPKIQAVVCVGSR